MIEQIVNWWNSSDIEFKIAMSIAVVMLIVVAHMVYGMTIKPVLEEIRKTTTQKYREGLIKK